MISETARAHRRDFVGGMRAMTPWLVGLVPFGLVIGVGAAQADIPTVVGWATGPTIYAGSAQVAVIQMLDAGAAPVAAIATALVINLRLVLYSAAMAPYWRGTPLWWRLLGAYLLVDPSFVVGTQRYNELSDQRRGHAHYLGGAVMLWITWLAAIAVGATAGAQLPAWLQLEFLIPLYLIGEIAPKLRQPASRTSVLVAGAVSLVLLAAPMHLGLAAGIVAGIAAGTLARTRAVTPPASPAAQPAGRPALSTKELHR